MYNDENFLPLWQGNIFSSVEETHEPTYGSVYCRRHWHIASQVGVGLTSRGGSSKALTLYIIRDRKHSLSPYMRLRRPHSVRDENREKVGYVCGVRVHLSVWYETHSDIGAEGWANMSYLDHTHSHKCNHAMQTHTYMCTDIHSCINTHIHKHTFSLRRILSPKQHQMTTTGRAKQACINATSPVPATQSANPPQHFPWLGAFVKRSQK